MVAKGAVTRKEFNALKKEVGQLTGEAPIPAEQAANMAAAREAQRGERADFIRVRPGNAHFATPVQADIQRLQGRSRSDLASDVARGAASPLEGRRKR
jgi:hypothetical protein